MSTYRNIQNRVKNTTGKTVKTCHIAHVKEMCGIPMGTAPNRKGDRKYPCPDDNVKPIKEALEFYKII